MRLPAFILAPLCLLSLQAATVTYPITFVLYPPDPPKGVAYANVTGFDSSLGELKSATLQAETSWFGTVTWSTMGSPLEETIPQFAWLGLMGLTHFKPEGVDDEFRSEAIWTSDRALYGEMTHTDAYGVEGILDWILVGDFLAKTAKKPTWKLDITSQSQEFYITPPDWDQYVQLSDHQFNPGDTIASVTYTYETIPEPSTYALLGLGIAVMFGVKRYLMT